MAIGFLRRRRTTHGSSSRTPWTRWILLTTLLLVLAAPFLLDLNIPALKCYHGKYRPTSATTAVRLPDLAISISIDRHGAVRFSPGGQQSLPVQTQAELRDAVAHVTATHPDRPVVLRIDRDIPYEQVQSTLAVLGESGVTMVYFHTVLPE